MQTPIGPSLNLMLQMADAFAEVSLAALSAGWKRWIGPERFHRKLAQFERLGWLDAPAGKANVERVIRLTADGRLAALGGRDPEACWRRPWDARWRLVLFDVPETRRALRIQLRRRLRGLRFGYLQNSVWITPDSVDALKAVVREAAIDVETLSFMEARPCAGESNADLVQGAWDFDQINRGYDLYLEVLKSRPVRRGGQRAWRNWFEVEWRAWIRALGADPLLPEALLPRPYGGKEAWRRRRETLRHLLRAK